MIYRTIAFIAFFSLTIFSQNQLFTCEQQIIHNVNDQAVTIKTWHNYFIDSENQESNADKASIPLLIILYFQSL